MEPIESLDPPKYRTSVERMVEGNRPLIVRLRCSLDSEQTGMVAPGGKLHVLETRLAADGSLRALVLVDATQATVVQSPRERIGHDAPPSPRSPRRARVRPTVPPDSWVAEGKWDEVETFDPLSPFSSDSSPHSLSTVTQVGTPGTTPYGTSRTHRASAELLARDYGPPVALSSLRGQDGNHAFRRTRELTNPKPPPGSVVPGARTRSPSPSLQTGAVSGEQLDELTATVESFTADVLSLTHGWVTAARDGHELLARVHQGIDAGTRRHSMELWERRKAADRLLSKVVQHIASEDRGTDDAGSKKLKLHTADMAERRAGPSLAHELTGMAEDPDGIGFAFGGADPGVLHAHGQVVKLHTVRYSIGLAGRYWLHVGLRQQETRLLGSPFLLEVSPGAAHARSSPLPAEALPLTGLVRPLKGGEVSCELLVPCMQVLTTAPLPSFTGEL